MDGFLRWLIDGGAHVDGLDVRELGGRRGVVALRRFATGEAVARVPRPLLITRELVRGSSIGRQIRDAGIELSNHHSLFAAWLLLERRDARSTCRPYLDVLPRDLSSFPIHATGAERALLAGTLAGELLDELRTAIDDDYVRLGERVRMFRAIDRDEFTWARLCVGARAFSVTIDGIGTIALVPFADLLNHHRDRHTVWSYDQVVAEFVLTAQRDIAVGDEVWNGYGAKGNGRFLVQYGFCVDDNADDEAQLCFPERFRVPRDPEHAASKQLHDWLRQRHRDDAAARAALVTAIRAALARLPATLDDDAVLARADRSPHVRNFIATRRGERAVLQAWLDRADQRA